MGRRIFCLIMILLLSHLPIIESASAQWAPAVNLECQAVNPSGNLEINVTNGSNITDYANCTVSNPSMYQEKIRILIQSNSLAVAAPSEINIAANSEVDFDVTVKADASTKVNHTIKLTIIAEVEEANGLPPPNSASDESNLLVEITVYEEANETENIVTEKSDGLTLVYAASGGVVLLLLILFVFLKKRK